MFSFPRPYPDDPNGDLLPLKKRNGVPDLDPNVRPVELPPSPKPIGYVADTFPRTPAALPAPASKPVLANPYFQGVPDMPAPPASAAPVPSATEDAALPTFSNKYDEMRWRGGVDFGGKGGDQMQRAEWEHMTRGGKFDPQHPTGKDRFREALMAGLLGAAQGAAQTGDWRGMVGGGGAGLAVGAFSPETARAMSWEPQRQQMMQRRHEDMQMAGEQAKIDYDRTRAQDIVRDTQIKEGKYKSEQANAEKKLALEAALNEAQIGNQKSQTGMHDAQANLYGVQAGERMAKLPGEVKKQQMEIALDQARQAEIRQRIAESQAKTPYEIQKIVAQVNAEYAQAANSRASAEGHRANIVKTQLETGTYDKVFPESDLSNYAQQHKMTVAQARQLLRAAGWVIE